tara:strand:- start:2660 stop:2839 length:180 start_codon:yes stop_codon:yes gene_type:complete
MSYFGVKSFYCFIPQSSLNLSSVAPGINPLKNEKYGFQPLTWQGVSEISEQSRQGSPLF